MSQLSQITIMFVVNLRKSSKVIVEPEKIEQNKTYIIARQTDRQTYSAVERKGMDTELYTILNRFIF